jgi:hypothetical protein
MVVTDAEPDRFAPLTPPAPFCFMDDFEACIAHVRFPVTR